MKKVFKYTIEPDDYINLLLPRGAEVLSIQEQDGHTQLWALVDPHNETEVRTFRLAGTGHPIEDDKLEFIGTFQLKNLGLVFHLFEVEP